jgi:hypothetical protein
LAVNTEAKPTAAFALSVIAGLMTIILAFVLPNSSPIFLLTDPSLQAMVQIWGAFSGLLIIAGSWLLYNNAAQRKLGSILALVFSLISLNFIGLILGLIGGFLGYSFKTTTTSTSGSSSSTGRSYNNPPNQ